jgi:hypothetical protein
MNCNICGNIGEVWERQEGYFDNPELKWKLIECPACLGSCTKFESPKIIIKPNFLIRLKMFFISIYHKFRQLCRR